MTMLETQSHAINSILRHLSDQVIEAERNYQRGRSIYSSYLVRLIAAQTGALIRIGDIHRGLSRQTNRRVKKIAAMFKVECPQCSEVFDILEHLQITTMIKYAGVFFLTITCPRCEYKEISPEESTAWGGID